MTALVPIHPFLTTDEYDLLLSIVAAGEFAVDDSDESLPKLISLGVVNVEVFEGQAVVARPTPRVHVTIRFEPPDNFSRK